MKISDYLARVIGYRNPFVVQGGAAVHMIDSLRGYKFVCCAHEQGAGFAADGYGKVKGLGVCITTCGPGATNLLTAAASAYFEGAPVLYLVGQQHDFQEVDVVGMFKSVTKFSKLVSDPKTLHEDLTEALRLSASGPVLLNIFDEVYRSEIEAPAISYNPPAYIPPKTENIFSKKRNVVRDFNFGRTYINPYKLMHELSLFGKTVVTDIGNHGVWVKQVHPQAIADNNFGAMGYALPASMGVACAGESVVSINGDGGIQMNIQELATIAKHDLDVKIFILNNSGYGMIRNTQDTWLKGRHTGCTHEDLPLVDFERVATAYGIPNRRWEVPEDMDFGILNLKGPVLINVKIPEDFPVL